MRSFSSDMKLKEQHLPKTDKVVSRRKTTMPVAFSTIYYDRLAHWWLYIMFCPKKEGATMQNPKDPPPAKFFEVPVQVRFGDTDPYGVVYFVSYFRYCHHGIEEFLRHLGLPPQELFRNPQEGFGLPIAGASCDFYRPVWYGESLRLAVSIVQVRGKALTFGFHFYQEGKDILVASGRATMVAIGADWKSRALPERLSHALIPYLPAPDSFEP
jgi:acyl-CoA thioester hydrolase